MPTAALGGGLLLGVAAATLLLSGDASPTVERTIQLSMKDFAFDGSNPTLLFHAGETVRIVVRNDEPDPRVLHSFRIPGLKGATCDVPIKPGEKREFIVRVPRSGDFVYTCCTHPGMGGSIQIGPDQKTEGSRPATK